MNCLSTSDHDVIYTRAFSDPLDDAHPVKVRFDIQNSIGDDQFVMELTPAEAIIMRAHLLAAINATGKGPTT